MWGEKFEVMSNGKNLVIKEKSKQQSTRVFEGMGNLGYEQICPDLLEYVKNENIDIMAELLALKVQNPSKDQKLTTVVQHLLDACKECGHEIRQYNGDRMYYNGKCWERLSDRDFNTVIKEASLLMHVPPENALHIDFITKVRTSFDVTRRWQPEMPKNVSKINCQNGTVVITDGVPKLMPHDPNDGICYVLPYDYDEKATAPKFDKFLKEVCPRKEDRDNLQEYAGYLFARQLRLQKCMFLYGATGQNGKSTFVNIITELCGKENVTVHGLDYICGSGSDGQSARLDISGKVLNVCTETAKTIKNAELFKTITAGEPIQARHMFKNDVEKITSYARLMFAGNELPGFESGAGTAEQRRFLIVEFSVRIPDEKKKDGLDDEIIEEELSGVLNWALQGCQRLMETHSFTKNSNSDRVAEALLNKSNSVAAYIHEMHMEPMPKDSGLIPSNARVRTMSVENLYRGSEIDFTSYTAWCESEGRKAVGRGAFSERLEKTYGFKKRRTKDGVVFEYVEVTPTYEDQE